MNQKCTMNKVIKDLQVKSTNPLTKTENSLTPYEEESAPWNDNILRSFHTGEVTQSRVSVNDDGIGTVGSANEDGQVAGIDNPAYDAQLTPDVEVEEIVDDVRGLESEMECAVDLEPDDEVSASIKAVFLSPFRFYKKRTRQVAQ